MSRLPTPVLIAASLILYAVGMTIALASVTPGDGGCVTTIWTPLGIAVVIAGILGSAWTAMYRGTRGVLLGLTLLTFLLTFAALAIAGVSVMLCRVGVLGPGD